MITIPGRIPITIHPFFWILCFGLGYLWTQTLAGTLIIAPIIFLSVLIHEFGHACSALMFGQQAEIDLVAMGGLTSRQGKRLKLWQEFIIIFCGPLAGLILAGLAFGGLIFVYNSDMTALVFALQVAIYVNLFWTVVNLLPIQPMDGGKLFSIILEGAFGVKGIKAALFISMLLAGGFAIFFFMMSSLLMGAIFLMFGYESYREWNQSKSMTHQDQDLGLQNLMHDIEKDLQDGHFPEAEQKLQQIRTQSKEGVLNISATTYLAQLWARQHKYIEAYEVLAPIANKLEGPSIPLMQQVAWKTGDFKTAIKFGDEAYQVDSTYQTALINAFCYSLSGDVTPAIGWLQRAINDGLPNVPQILQRKEFDPIRNDQAFRDLSI